LGNIDDPNTIRTLPFEEYYLKKSLREAVDYIKTQIFKNIDLSVEKIKQSKSDYHYKNDVESIKEYLQTASFSEIMGVYYAVKEPENNNFRFERDYKKFSIESEISNPSKRVLVEIPREIVREIFDMRFPFINNVNIHIARIISRFNYATTRESSFLDHSQNNNVTHTNHILRQDARDRSK
jgi:hypothetical protein